MMGEYVFKQVDFEKPSALFVLEDVLKGLIGGPVLYGPYFRTFGMKGDEKVLDFGFSVTYSSIVRAECINLIK